MQPRLIRLLIVSRFSRPLIIVMAFVLAYSVIMGFTIPPEDLQMGPFWQYYLISITAFFLVLMTMVGRIAIMKSDLDYLFTMPLSRRELAVSFYITQFLATGISYLIIFGYVFAYILGSLSTKLLIAGDMVLIGLLQTALSIVAFRLSTFQKGLLAAGMGIYAISPILGFQYSFTSVFTGHIIEGTLAIVVLNVIFNYFALSQLGTIELGFTRMSAMRSSSDYKSTEHFSGLTRRAAIMKRYIREISFTGRFNLGGSVSVRVSRIKLRTILIPMTAIAAVYLYISYRLSPTDGTLGPAIMVAAIYIGIFIPMFFPEVFSHERAWLAFSAMNARAYWLYVVYAKTIQIFVMMIPFMAADIILYFMGIGGALNSLIFVAGVIPTSPVLSLVLSSRFSPAQVIDMETMPSEFTLRQMATLLPVLLFTVAAVISMISLIAALVCAAFFILLSVAAMSGTRRWNRVVYRLTERGFV